MAKKDQKGNRRLSVVSAAKKGGVNWWRKLVTQIPLSLIMIRFYLLISLALILVFLALPSSFPGEVTLEIGDIADRNIKADRDLIVLDQASTAAKKKAASRDSLLVFDLDDQAATRSRELIQSIFSEGRALYQPPPNGALATSEDALPDIETRKEEFAEKFNATFGFGRKYAAFKTLDQIEFSEEAENIIVQLVEEFLSRGILADSSLESGEDTRITVRHIFSKKETTQLLNSFPDATQAQNEVMERALLYRGDFKAWQIKIMGAIAQAMLQPNMSLNRTESDKRKQEAVANVTPVYIQVERGEMIVREGERVDLEARLKLEAQARAGGELTGVFRLSGLFLLAIVFIFTVYAAGSRIFPQILRLKDRDIVLLTLLLIMSLLLAAIMSTAGQAMVRGGVGLEETTVLYLAPLAAMGMVATIFLGSAPAFLFAVTASILTGLLLNSFTLSIYYFIGTIAGSAGVSQVKERGASIKSGLLVALANIVTLLGLSFYADTFLTAKTLWDTGAGLLNGLLAGIIVTGLIPLFEMIFQYTTNVKLLELANLDRPILRELMVQAPGTYHHSVIVGALVEAAGEAIGANHLLAKVSAYYHDLGKLKKPLYFVENQGGGENRHEKLAPSMSSLILISHIKDGVELARQNKLGQDIIDIIREHHGTSVISYFYQKAREGQGEGKPEINDEDYRYPGPKPQTKEAGLVMLADAVEAASRTLVDPTPARIQGLVQKIINNFFSDGQLDDCELTLKDLHLIASTFNKILTGIFHRRIEYPEPPTKEADKSARAANDNRNSKPSNNGSDKDRPAKDPGKEDLKRLGIPRG